MYRRGRVQWGVALLVAAALGAAACSSGGDGGDGGQVSGGGASAERRAAGGQPSGDDPEAVRPYVEALVAGYDEAVNALVAEPSLAADRAAPTVRAYLDVFEPDSAEADEALAGWAGAGEEGGSVRPLNAATPMIATTVDGGVETVGDDEVVFATCAEHHYQQLDGTGTVVDVVDVVGLAGEGVAVRVDGAWRLRTLELRDDRPSCATERGST